MPSSIVRVLVVVCLAGAGSISVSTQQQPASTPQQPTTPPPTSDGAKLDLMAIRSLMAAGEIDDARRLLAKAPRTREYQELRFDLERQVRDVAGAVAAWEDLAATSGPDWKRLGALATDLATDLRRSDDPVIRVQACGVLLRAKRRDCIAELQRAGGDPSLSWGLRLQALKELAFTGDSRAKEELAGAASEAVSGDPVAALQAMADADPVAAVTTFSAVLASANRPPDQYQAAYLLGDAGVRSKEAGQRAAHTLSAFLQTDPKGPARLAATISLARLGGPDETAALRAVLPQLDGYERLMAGVALAERGNRDGVPLIRSTAPALSEQLQLEAAVRLAPWDRDAAAALLTAQVRSQNPVARVAALQAWPQIQAAPPAPVRKALADVDQSVRAAAIVAVTSPFVPSTIRPERRQ